MKPALEYLRTRLCVDVNAGKVKWIDATKHHVPLNGTEAGCSRISHSGKFYWHIKIDGTPIKRANIIFLFAYGRWPEPMVDHINGDSLDDRISNLREVTATQNAWNHKGRKKKTGLPMGVRELPSGRFQARIACNHKKIQIGTFSTLEQAVSAYQQKRKEMFGDYA